MTAPWSTGTCGPCPGWRAGTARTPEITWPSSCLRPVFILSKPVSRLKNVVLPAPFGPMRAVIEPRWISRCSTSTAVRPPKWRLTSSTIRIGSGLAEPGTLVVDARDRVVMLLHGIRPAARSRDPERVGAGFIGHRAPSPLAIPKMPCGRKRASSTSPRPTRMKRTWLT